MRWEPRSSSSRPSARMPVPASRTRKLLSSSETSTQDVFPPYSTVSGPGVGTEPRQPQIVTRISRLPPEDRDDADELVCMCKEWEGGYFDLALDSVKARDPKPFVCRAALVESDPRRPAFGRSRFQIRCPGRELRDPVVERHLAALREGKA